MDPHIRPLRRKQSLSGVPKVNNSHTTTTLGWMCVIVGCMYATATLGASVAGIWCVVVLVVVEGSSDPSIYTHDDNIHLMCRLGMYSRGRPR